MHLFIISTGVMLGAVLLIGAIGYIGSKLSREVIGYTKGDEAIEQSEWS